MADKKRNEAFPNRVRVRTFLLAEYYYWLQAILSLPKTFSKQKGLPILNSDKDILRATLQNCLKKGNKSV